LGDRPTAVAAAVVVLVAFGLRFSGSSADENMSRSKYELGILRDAANIVHKINIPF
jgi:hypothetical protein